MSSISSFSTTAAAVKTVGMLFYQPAGRWIERLSMQLTIWSVNPDQMPRYIEAKTVFCYSWDDKNLPLHDIIMSIRGRPNGSTFIAGLKTLVKQTQ